MTRPGSSALFGYDTKPGTMSSDLLKEVRYGRVCVSDRRCRSARASPGSGPNAAHINTVLGAKDGPVGTAWATALATPRLGHAPFVVVVRPNVPVKPFTLFVNKAAIDGETNERHAQLTWGAAQAGVAAGVAAAVRTGVVSRGRCRRRSC